MKLIDSFLNRITMYRLVLYYLFGLILTAFFLSIFHILPFNPLSIAFSSSLLVIVCYLTNTFFAKSFKAVTNNESWIISALILALIITPIKTTSDLPFLLWAAVCTMGGKFIFAYRKKHLFNPVALGVFIPSLFLHTSSSWWVGSSSMFFPVLLGGLLIARKIRRFNMVSVLIAAAAIVILQSNFLRGPDFLSVIKEIFLLSPLLFFAFVMFTEPLTSPPTKNRRTLYAVLTGILFAPQFHLGNLYTTPESALLVGNLFSWLVSFKPKIILSLQEKIQLSPDQYDFVFNSPVPVKYQPGQYMEWTLPTSRPDSRGNRRYFTLASSPTEDTLRLGVKFHNPSSAFKKTLSEMLPGQTVTAHSLMGDFTLLADKKKKLAFLAGGIGITPFRSMTKYLLDKNEKRDIKVIYSNKTEKDFVYKDLLLKAEKQLNISTTRNLTDTGNVPSNWNGEIGKVTPEMISKHIPDFGERTFYLSGPQTMVQAYKEMLLGMGLPPSQIKTDYFPGF